MSIVGIELALIPLLHFAISSGLSLIALHATQSVRFYFAPFILFFAGLSFRHLSRMPSWLGLDSLWGLFITIYVAHITAALYVEKWTLASTEELSTIVLGGSSARSYKQSKTDLRAAYRIWSNPRRLDLRKDDITTADIRPESKSERGTSSMRCFILIRAIKLCCYALIHHIISSQIFPGAFRPMSIDDFSPYREHYLSRIIRSKSFAAMPGSTAGDVTLRETLLRAFLAIDWAVAAYLVLEGCHHVFALLFVCVLRLDSSADWPPLFGDIRQITSIRRFWGGFWHRLAVGPYGSHASAFSQKIAGFKRGSKADKIFVTFCIFLCSGLAHSAVSWQMGQRCGVWRDVAWFMANFGAGAVEAGVQSQCATLARRIGWGQTYDGFASGWRGKVIGVLWVFAFFFWSVPKWQFPKIYCATLLEIYAR